jgi:hypothetical protein
MTDISDHAQHTVRIHQPFSIPKQWVCGSMNALGFTEESSKAGRYSLRHVAIIHESLHRDFPNAVIVTDGI